MYLALVAQDLRLLDGWVREAEWPHVACPTCGDGSLAIKSIETEDCGESIRYRNHEDWEPEWLHGTFHGALQCARSACQETVAIAGDYKTDMVRGADVGSYSDYNSIPYDSFFRLRFSIPPLTLVALPGRTPEAVATAVNGAAAVIWTDPNAAANRLRVAVEELLTANGQRRFEVKKHKRVRLTTHRRIEEFKQDRSEAAEALEAVKWIGNEGSHAAELGLADVLEGAGFLGYALRLLYDDEDEQLASRIRSVNRARGVGRRTR